MKSGNDHLRLTFPNEDSVSRTRDRHDRQRKSTSRIEGVALFFGSGGSARVETGIRVMDNAFFDWSQLPPAKIGTNA